MSNKNKKTKILLSSLLTTICLYAGQSFAEDMPIDFYPSVQPIISVAAGMGVSELGKSQNVTLIPASSPFGPFNYGYEANKKSQTTSFGQVFIGARWNTSPSFSVQAGLMGYYYRPFKLSGVIDLTGLNSGLRNYSYNYKIHSMGLIV